MNNNISFMKCRKGSEKFKMEFYSIAIGKLLGKKKRQGNIGYHTGFLAPSKLSLWSLNH